MTRAKDISKIITDADLSGTLDVTGAVTADGLTVDGTGVSNFTSTSTTPLQVNGASIPTLRVNNTVGSVSTDIRATTTEGIVRTATNHSLVLGTNQIERMRIDSSGNVGIGTSSPSHLLHLYSADARSPSILLENNSAGDSDVGIIFAENSENYAYRIGTDDSGNTFRITYKSGGIDPLPGTDDDRLVIAANGNVGIGTDSPVRAIHVESSDSLVGRFKSTGSTEGFIQLAGSGTGTAPRLGATGNHLLAYTSDTERMRVLSNGKVLIGSTADPSDTTGLYVKATDPTDLFSGQITAKGTATSGAIDTGAGITFEGHNGSGNRWLGSIQVLKENSTVGNNDSFMRFSTRDNTSGATERMRIDSNGSITSTAASGNMASFSSTTNAVEFKILSPTANVVRLDTGASDVLAFAPTGTEAMRIDTSGRVAIGTNTNTVYYNSTSTYTSSLALKTNISNEVAEIVIINGNNNFGSTIDFARTNTSSNDVRYASLGGYADSNTAGSESGHIRFSTKGTSDSNIAERMRITSSGQILINTSSKISTDQGEGFAVHANTSSAGSCMEVKNTGNPASNRDFIRFYNTSNGEAGSIEHNGTSSVAYLTSSDYRLKENVVTNWDATTRLKQLKPSRFNFIADADRTVDGFLAHEVQSVVPEAISGSKDEVDADGNPVYQGIDQSKLVPLLVKTIQELEARIVALETA